MPIVLTSNILYVDLVDFGLYIMGKDVPRRTLLPTTAHQGPIIFLNCLLKSPVTASCQIIWQATIHGRLQCHKLDRFVMNYICFILTKFQTMLQIIP